MIKVRHLTTLAVVSAAIILSTILAACGPGKTPSPTPAPTQTPLPSTPSVLSTASEFPARILTVMTHDSFAASESVIKAFEDQYNVQVRFLESGDTGMALNKAILSKNNPLADVFYGVDNTFLSRALDEDIFESYQAPQLAGIPESFQLDPQQRAIPVDYGDVCLNYDKAYFSEKGLAPPENLEDLLKPEYKDLLVVENPASSSPGLAFLLATIGRFGEEGYLVFWRKLVNNGVLVVNDWETAYNSEFTRAGGSRPIVVSYASSPVFELIYAEQPLDEPPTAAVSGSGSCFRQIEFAGILKGTKNRDLAEKWIDFMLSSAFQEDLPLQMFVFPVNPKAMLDEHFQQYLANPQNPTSLEPAEIAAKREKWIQEWTDTVLR